jgi:hypothetical protein
MGRQLLGRFSVALIIAGFAGVAVSRASVPHDRSADQPKPSNWSMPAVRHEFVLPSSTAQASECVRQQAPSVDCKCGANGQVKKAACYITVKPLTGEKCGGPYCDSCYVVCNRP